MTFKIPENEGDIYKKAASKAFNVPYNDVTTVQRQVAKRALHMRMYTEDSSTIIKELYKEN